MKQISLKGLADFMTAGPHKQRTILREFKYPDENEAKAKILYYREARDRIRVFHQGNHPPVWLGTQANVLESLAAGASGATRTRLWHNARALYAYADHFGRKHYDTLKELVLGLTFGDVRVTAVPDLHVREEAQEKIIKLDFANDPPIPRVINIVSQVFFEAANQAGLTLPTSSVLYVDIARGRTHRGARIGARLRRDLHATCQTISAIWDQL